MNEKNNTFTKLDNYKLALKYSEDKEKLQKLISDIEIYYQIKGYDYYFADDENKRYILNIKVKRNQEINFTFGLSINDSDNLLIKDCRFNSNKVQDILYSRKFNRNNIDLFNENYTKFVRKVKKDIEKIFNDLSYSVLCSVKNDFDINQYDFNEFCDMFGYDNDSIKAKKSYDLCVEQAIKLNRIFNENELDCLPS